MKITFSSAAEIESVLAESATFRDRVSELLFEGMYADTRTFRDAVGQAKIICKDVMGNKIGAIKLIKEYSSKNKWFKAAVEGYYTTKAVGGYQLGLDTAKAFVEEHVFTP